MKHYRQKYKTKHSMLNHKKSSLKQPSTLPSKNEDSIINYEEDRDPKVAAEEKVIIKMKRQRKNKKRKKKMKKPIDFIDDEQAN